jgi:hypothetical protein
MAYHGAGYALLGDESSTYATVVWSGYFEITLEDPQYLQRKFAGL